MRIFGSEKLDGMLQSWVWRKVRPSFTLGLIRQLKRRSRRLRRAILRSASMLKYDDVMNDQRSVIFLQRKEIMHAEDVQELSPKCVVR